MLKKAPMLAVVGAMLAGCSLAPDRACPAATFPAFVEAFAETGALQATHTAPEVVVSVMDVAAEPEPAPLVRRTRRVDLDFPVIPDAAVRRAQGRELKIAPHSAAALAAVLVKPDTDWQVVFVFEPYQRCWRLIRIDDASL